MRTGGLNSFRSRFRGAEALLVDDVHFLAAKRATQDEFLHTFNALVAGGVPIVMAADQHPRKIARLTDELATRFLGGMVVKLDTPDLATRRAILKAKAAARGVDVPDAVARLRRRAPPHQRPRARRGAAQPARARPPDGQAARPGPGQDGAPRHDPAHGAVGRAARRRAGRLPALRDRRREPEVGQPRPGLDLSPDAGDVPGPQAHRRRLQRDRPLLRRPEPLDGHLGREEGAWLAPRRGSDPAARRVRERQRRPAALERTLGTT